MAHIFDLIILVYSKLLDLLYVTFESKQKSYLEILKEADLLRPGLTLSNHKLSIGTYIMWFELEAFY